MLIHYIYRLQGAESQRCHSGWHMASVIYDRATSEHVANMWGKVFRSGEVILPVESDQCVRENGTLFMLVIWQLCRVVERRYTVTVLKPHLIQPFPNQNRGMLWVFYTPFFFLLLLFFSLIRAIARFSKIADGGGAWPQRDKATTVAVSSVRFTARGKKHLQQRKPHDIPCKPIRSSAPARSRENSRIPMAAAGHWPGGDATRGRPRSMSRM